MSKAANVKPRVSLQENGAFYVSWTSEAQMRAGLARVARAYGWWVREEVVVPGWGRIDLVLRRAVSEKPWLIELKLALNKPSEVRRAFQQADGYSRWWAQHHGEANLPIVSSPKPRMDVIQPVADAYPGVPYRSVAELLGGFLRWEVNRERVDAAYQRVAEARRELDLDERAHEQLRNLARARSEEAAWTEHAERTAVDPPPLFPSEVDF